MRPKHSDCYDAVFARNRKPASKEGKRGYGECEIEKYTFYINEFASLYSYARI